MAHLIQTEEPKPKKQYRVRMPDIVGKFGFSLELGKKQIFFGVAVADIEVESVVKKKKLKVFRPGTKTRFLEL